MKIANESFPPLNSVPENASDGLLKQIFRATSHDRSTGLVVALTAVDPGAGVTYLADSLAEELGADNGGNVVCLDCRALTQLEQESNTQGRLSIARLAGSLEEDEGQSVSRWTDSYSFRESILNVLRARYQYVLIACPSLHESSDVLSIAPMVDGVLLVVEANGTRTRQIAVTERTILAARGRILGHILNKRKYFIPAWVYTRLAAFGI